MITADIVVDHGPAVGLGHLRRCLVLADELRRRGIPVRMLVPTDEGRALARAHGHDIGTFADVIDAGIVVVDAYGLEPATLVTSPRSVTLWIDDIGGRRLDADLVLNVNGYGPDVDYGGRPRFGVLAGLEYSLVSPAFVAARSATGRAGVLVAFGGTDDGTLGIATATALRVQRPHDPVDVVVSPLHDGPRQDVSGVTVHHGADMVTLMAARKVYVGAAGTTSYEALAAGMAVVTCPTIDNQEPNARFLASLGADVLPAYDRDALVAAAVGRLDAPLPPPPPQPDGRGAARVVDRLLEVAGIRCEGEGRA